MKTIYLAKKPDGQVVFHTSLNALRDIDGIAHADMEISEEEFSAAGNLARIINGDIFIGKTEAETAAENAEKEIAQIKGELAARDYRALKAIKLGQNLDDLYPGESEWYQGKLARMEELEQVIAGVAGSPQGQ